MLGRVVVRERVLRKVAQAAAADHVGVDRGSVVAAVADGRDSVAVRLRTPVPVPDLRDTAAIESAGPILEQAERLQADLRSVLARIYGREVARIDLTIDGATTPVKRRVR